MIAALVAGSSLLWFAEGRKPSHAPASPLTEMSTIAAAPGRIEGSSETTALGAATSGILQRVYVRQGEHVAKDQLLARIECDDIAAEIAQRTAEQAAVSRVM
jgi:multidrug efflux pump subunit AcrA (membrane-fusion protein)